MKHRNYVPPGLTTSAFTLMEMMLVLAIIAMLISIGAVTMRNMEINARIVAARAQTGAISSAVLQYKTVNRAYPKDLEALVTPPRGSASKAEFMSASGIVDPWGEKYQYRLPGKKHPRTFDVFSFGDDKADPDDEIYQPD